MAANRKKPAAKSPATAKRNLPVNIQEQLAAESQDIASRISAPTGDRVRYNANQGFYLPDGTEGEVLEVIVLDFVAGNFFYDRPYDRDNPIPPACFALGQEPKNLVPSTNSPDRQADMCSVCPLNQFGSADNGKGKACKNSRLVAVTPVPNGDEQGDLPIWVMSIPPASIKAFDAYVQTISTKHSTVPVGVLTEVSMDPGSMYAAPRFKALRKLEDEVLEVVYPARKLATERMLAEPDVTGYEPPKAKRRR